MKKIILALVVSANAFAYGNGGNYQYVNPYVRHDGTQVNGYYRSEPQPSHQNTYNHDNNDSQYGYHKDTTYNSNSNGYNYGR